jgi:hypothetical protein
MQNWFGGTDVFHTKFLSNGLYEHWWVPCKVEQIFVNVAVNEVVQYPYIKAELEFYDAIDADIGWEQMEFLPTHP